MINLGKNIFFYGENEDETMAKLEFKLIDEIFYIDNILIIPHLKGQGLAADLVKAAIKYCKNNGLHLAPLCTYARSYLNK